MSTGDVPRGARPSWADDLNVLDRIEAALTKEQHAALHHTLQTGGIEPDAWLSIPSLRQDYTLAAALNIRAAITETGGSNEKGWAEASHRLGIPAETLVTWHRRWLGYAA